MRNRLYIFSSKAAASALLWAVALSVAFEIYNAYTLPGKYSSHEVDTLLHDLDTQSCPAPVVLMGDSVGRQIGSALVSRGRGGVVSIAGNAAVETAGQYFILQRYLDHNPAPRKVVLMMGSPLIGDLDSVYAENFVQRCFLRWSEIVDVAIVKKDPVFSAMMIAYKILPSLRYRLHLQKTVPGLKTQDIYFGWLDLSGASDGKDGKSGHGLMTMLKSPGAKLNPRESISSSYCTRLVKLLDERRVRIVFVLPPLPESKREDCDAGGYYAGQIRVLEELSKSYPMLHVVRVARFYPDDWFSDRTHLKPEYLQGVVDDYSRLLDDKS